MALRPGGGIGSVKAPLSGTLSKIKGLFLDRAAVQKALGQARYKGLMRFGGRVRVTAQRSMRRRKKGFSAPGQPPFAKEGDLREKLYYVYDPSANSVVVGPMGYDRSTTPALHEFGGTRMAHGEVIEVKNKAGRNAQGRFVSAGVRKVKLNGVMKYPARPYMRPALAKIASKFAESFRNTFGR